LWGMPSKTTGTRNHDVVGGETRKDGVELQKPGGVRKRKNQTKGAFTEFRSKQENKKPLAEKEKKKKRPWVRYSRKTDEGGGESRVWTKPEK